MTKFLIELIEKHDPAPARRSDIALLVEAGELAVAVEIIAVNCFDNNVALNAEEKHSLIEAAMHCNLPQDYLEMIESLPVLCSDKEEDSKG